MKFVTCTHPAHAAAILDLFNEAIVHSTALYDYQPRPPESMVDWFRTKEANGIQALDLVTRKIGLDGGAAIERLFAEIQGDIEGGPTALAALLQGTLQALRESTGWIRSALPRDLAAGASDYLQLFGVVMIGWMWLRMATLGKTTTARFYLARTLPEAKMLAARLRTGNDLLTGEL